MLIRAEFRKLHPVRYISHLELMDTFRRCFRRANLPVAFSEGYNPHIKLSLGQPLSVGMKGYAEYFDVELTSQLSEQEFVKSCNDKLPSGIRITEAREVPSGVRSLQAVVNTAIYQFIMEFQEEIASQKIIRKFLQQEEIKIIRFRRNKEDRELDLKPLLYSGEVVPKKEAVASISDRKNRQGSFAKEKWRFTVSTGSSGNVRPAEVIRALADFDKRIIKIPVVNIIREGMFVRLKKELYKPFSSTIVRR